MLQIVYQNNGHYSKPTESIDHFYTGIIFYLYFHLFYRQYFIYDNSHKNTIFYRQISVIVDNIWLRRNIFITLWLITDNIIHIITYDFS